MNKLIANIINNLLLTTIVFITLCFGLTLMYYGLVLLFYHPLIAAPLFLLLVSYILVKTNLL